MSENTYSSPMPLFWQGSGFECKDFTAAVKLLQYKNTKNQCKGLTAVTAFNKLEYIDKYAFSECNKLKDVYYVGNSSKRESINIESGNEALTDATRYYVTLADLLSFEESIEDFGGGVDASEGSLVSEREASMSESSETEDKKR